MTYTCPWLDHPEHEPTACLHCATDEQLEQAATRIWTAPPPVTDLPAAAVTAAADPTTETEGFRAYKAGVAAGRAEGAAAERERCAQLIEQQREIRSSSWYADLLRKDTPPPVGADAEPGDLYGPPQPALD